MVKWISEKIKKPITALYEGEWAKIHKIKVERGIEQYLKDRGLVKGTIVNIGKYTDDNGTGTLHLTVKGEEIALRESHARNITVETIRDFPICLRPRVRSFIAARSLVKLN